MNNSVLIYSHLVMKKFRLHDCSTRSLPEFFEAWKMMSWISFLSSLPSSPRTFFNFSLILAAWTPALYRQSYICQSSTTAIMISLMDKCKSPLFLCKEWNFRMHFTRAIFVRTSLRLKNFPEFHWLSVSKRSSSSAIDSTYFRPKSQIHRPSLLLALLTAWLIL